MADNRGRKSKGRTTNRKPATRGHCRVCQAPWYVTARFVKRYLMSLKKQRVMTWSSVTVYVPDGFTDSVLDYRRRNLKPLAKPKTLFSVQVVALLTIKKKLSH